MPYFEMPDGVPIHYVDEGPRAAQAIVMIPAEPFSCWFWQKNVPDIGRYQRVIALDLRGRGQSGKGETRHTIPQFARDVAVLLGGLDVERCVGVGWSIGGSVWWSFFDQFGDARLAGIVNVDQRPYRWVSQDHFDNLVDEIRRNRLAYHRERVIEFLGPEFDQDSALVDRMTYECMKTPTHAHLEAADDSYHSDYRPTMARLRVPTTLFVGKYGLIGPELADELRAVAPSELVHFAHSGHLMPWTEPDQFNTEVVAFARRCIGDT